MDTEKLIKQIENLSITSKSFEELVIASKKKYDKLDSLSANSDGESSDCDGSDSESTRTSDSSSNSSDSSTTSSSSDSLSDSFSGSDDTSSRKKKHKHKKKPSKNQNAIDVLLRNDESTDEQLIPRGPVKPDEQNDTIAKTKTKQRRPRKKKQTIKQILENQPKATTNTNNSIPEGDTNYLQYSPQSSSSASYTQSTSTGSVSDESKELNKNIELDPHYINSQYSPQSLSSLGYSTTTSLGSPFGTELSDNSLPSDLQTDDLYLDDIIGHENTLNIDELISPFDGNVIESDDSNLPSLLETLMNSEIPDYEESNETETLMSDQEKRQICSVLAANKKIDEIIRKKSDNNNTLFHILANSKIYNTYVDELTAKIFKLHDKNVDLPSDVLVEYIIARVKRASENAKKSQEVLESLVNQTNSHFETPLTLAIKFDRVELLQLLYPYANMKFRKQPELYSPLQIACCYGSQKCFFLLLQNYYTKTENLECFIHNDIFGNNCLALAIQNHNGFSIDNTKIIKTLAKHGSVDLLKVKNANGNTFAHLLCQNKSFKPNDKITILKDLRATNADIFELTNDDGKTAWTSYKGNNSYLESEFRALVLQWKNEIYN